MKRTEIGTPDIGFGLYVHWPFCLAKCPYCDFNSHVRHDGVDHEAFGNALVAELQHFASRTPGRIVTSVFFGGGTPSLMQPGTVGRVLDAAADSWGIAEGAEITLEANPTSAEAGNFRGYRSAGVNRVSVGVQALSDTDLAALGRQHSVDEALGAFRTATQIFPQTSFDLIYARPRQTAGAWRAELQRALDEQQGHMSLYQLTIEPDTPFASLHARDKLIVPGDDAAADLYDVTQELTAAAGLPAYEVSNHAWRGRQSRHNMLYWRYGEYAGIGPGAHSRLIDEQGQRISVSTLKDPKAWQQQVIGSGHGI
ncbi:MAG: radical SAM family heme chaperone HemW, partial [Aestuariivirgaceae bacterium]